MQLLHFTFCVVAGLSYTISIDAAYCAHGRAGEDEIRDEVLAPVNAERQLVSSGGRQNGRTGTNLPAARSMLDLVWSCSLEMEAISILNNASCEFHPSSLPADKAYIYVSDYTYEEGFDFVIKPHISRIVEDELTVITTDEVKYNDESMLKSYASLIRETTTVIACAKLECPTLLHAFLCLTDEPFLQTGDTIYEVAPTTVSTTTMESTIATTTAIPNVAYCPNGQVAEVDIKDEVLTPINTERQLVASGRQLNGRNGTKLPAAASMPNLTWSCSLELEAISILNNGSCEEQLSSPPADKANIYVTGSYIYFGEHEFSFVITSYMHRIWEDELTSITTSEVKYNDESELKAYATLIRATTTEIACANSRCSGSGPEDIIATLCLTNEPFLQTGDTIYEVAPTTVSPTTTASTTAVTTATSSVAYCPNGQLTEADINDKVLTPLNTERQLVLNGKRQNGKTGNYLPAAISIPDLKWSCSLEMEAIRILPNVTCQFNSSLLPADKAYFLYINDYYEGEGTMEFDYVLDMYFKEIQYFGIHSISASEVKYDSSEPYVATYANLIRSTTTEIACAKNIEKKCPEYPMYAILCLTNKPFLKNDEVIYEYTPTTVSTTTESSSTSATGESTGDEGMTDELRNAFLAEHNKLRSALALGQVPNGNNANGTSLRKANKMPTLVYCYELEKTAYDRAKQCEEMDSSVENMTENTHNYTDRLNSSLETAATAAVQLWWSELQATTGIDQIQNLFFVHAGFQSFAKIASDLTTGVGCGIVRCQTLINIVCHYETTLTNGAKLYSYGPSCRRCPEGVDSCVDGLCPATEGQCPETTTPVATTTGPPNTVCPSNVGMNDPLRTAILDKHNAFRSALALGNVSNGQTGNMCRKASKMPTLTYNCDLEKTAYENASKCEQMGSTSPDNLFENSYKFTTNLTRTLTAAAEDAANLWWTELSLLEEGIDQIQNLYFSHMGISSFAKMASELTTQVGCGVVHCGDMINVVCHYNTTLVNGGKLYTLGPSCRKCPEGETSCVNGLCPAE